jgi:hypothetical protein
MAKQVSQTGDSTAAICQKTALRAAGFQGDGTDDHMIHRIWMEWFGSEKKIRFTLRPRAKAKTRFSEGSGSKVLHKVLKARLKAKKTLCLWLGLS